MAPQEPSELVHLLWFAGWCVAMLVLFGLGIRLPLQRRLSHWAGVAYTAGSVVAAMGVTVLANVALVGHDVHFDLTRERVFTPSRQALEVVDRLSQDVDLTYFYHAQDPNSKRLKELMAVLGRRNPRLHVRTIDPDSQPSLAHTYGVRLYNAAVLEAEGRRLVVHSTDENDIAIGIQRVVREREGNRARERKLHGAASRGNDERTPAGHETAGDLRGCVSATATLLPDATPGGSVARDTFRELLPLAPWRSSRCSGGWTHRRSLFKRAATIASPVPPTVAVANTGP